MEATQILEIDVLRKYLKLTADTSLYNYLVLLGIVKIHFNLSTNPKYHVCYEEFNEDFLLHLLTN
jgi:hypothetical protein